MVIPDPVSSPSESHWHIDTAPSDPILALHQAYLQDRSPTAVNLSVGAYLDSAGRAHEFRSVRSARLFQSSSPTFDHSYLPIAGLQALSSLSARLIYGDNTVDDARVAILHTVSGSCALRLALSFAAHVLGAAAAYISTPAWPNHAQMVPAEGLKLARYTYYDARRHAVDVEGMLADLVNARRGDVVVLQPCAHNPTGADLTERQWARVADVVERRALVPLFDMAYQGLASGDVVRDAYAVRMFADRGINFLVAQSFSKNLGLYNSRVGTVSLCVAGGMHATEMVKNAASQISWLARGMYSSPPAHGARIAASVLGEQKLREDWVKEIGEMVQRMRSMRDMLRDQLERRQVPGEWEHVTETTGMFVLLGLTPAQVERLRTLHHVYITKDSRINVAGLTEANVATVAHAIAEVIRHSISAAETNL